MLHKARHEFAKLSANVIHGADVTKQLDALIPSIKEHMFHPDASAELHLRGLKELREHLEQNFLSDGHREMSGAIISHGLIKKNGLGLLQRFTDRYSETEVPDSVQSELEAVKGLAERYLEIFDQFQAVKDETTWESYLAEIRSEEKAVV